MSEVANYCLMFDLAPESLTQRILDYSPGFSSFNAEMHELGYRMTSTDELYSLSFGELQKEADAYLANLSVALGQADRYLLKNYVSTAEFFAQQQTKCQRFLADFLQGSEQHRYNAFTLPTLPYCNFDFQFALSGNRFFARADLTLEKVIQELKELCRVALEVRVYPLLNEHGKNSDLVPPLILALQTQGYGVEVREVDFEMEKGGNAMLRVMAQECPLSQ